MSFDVTPWDWRVCLAWTSGLAALAQPSTRANHRTHHREPKNSIHKTRFYYCWQPKSATANRGRHAQAYRARPRFCRCVFSCSFAFALSLLGLLCPYISHRPNSWNRQIARAFCPLAPFGTLYPRPLCRIKSISKSLCCIRSFRRLSLCISSNTKARFRAYSPLEIFARNPICRNSR